MSKGIAGPKLPILITEIAYSKAAVAANMVGLSLRDYTEAALEIANQKTFERHQTRLYVEARRHAMTHNEIMPTRHEFDREQKPFVRRPAGVEDESKAGRPSSRHHQNGMAHRPGQKREAAPERPGATRSEASMARTREEPPFDRAEHHGSRPHESSNHQRQN